MYSGQYKPNQPNFAMAASFPSYIQTERAFLGQQAQQQDRDIQRKTGTSLDYFKHQGQITSLFYKPSYLGGSNSGQIQWARFDQYGNPIIDPAVKSAEEQKTGYYTGPLRDLKHNMTMDVKARPMGGPTGQLGPVSMASPWQLSFDNMKNESDKLKDKYKEQRTNWTSFSNYAQENEETAAKLNKMSYAIYR